MRTFRGLMDEWMAAVTGRQPEASADPDADDFVSARRDMVREQLLRGGRDISDEAVVTAMSRVPRHQFVPEHLKSRAYNDCALSVGWGQTISQPYIVAFMTEQLKLRPGDSVLEIGTGSGYQTAILAELAAQVFSIEIVPELAEGAAAVLNGLGYTNVHLRLGDGHNGWPEAAPFDGIIGTCAPDEVPEALVEQLAEGGRMVIPVGGRGRQNIIVLRKCGGRLDSRAVLPVQFVPMTGGIEERPTSSSTSQG
jgi:protein-L-isoaspartate(D-aspartate) O-methyltransferase